MSLQCLARILLVLARFFQLRKAARLGRPRSKGSEQQELSELSRVAISEGHVACLRVITDGCREQVSILLFGAHGVDIERVR